MARAGESVELAAARGHDPRARHRVVGRQRPGCARSPCSTSTARPGRTCGRSRGTSAQLVGGAAYLGVADAHGVRPVHARRRQLARRHPGCGRRRAGRPAAAPPAARHRPRRLPRGPAHRRRGRRHRPRPVRPTGGRPAGPGRSIPAARSRRRARGDRHGLQRPARPRQGVRVARPPAGVPVA